MSRARAVGYVASLALGTLQGKQLAERIELLELVLKAIRWLPLAT